MLKTKIPGNYPSDLVREQHTDHVIEIPTEEGTLTIRGQLRTMGSSPNMSEYGFEIRSRSLAENHER